MEHDARFSRLEQAVIEHTGEMNLIRQHVDDGLRAHRAETNSDLKDAIKDMIAASHARWEESRKEHAAMLAAMEAANEARRQEHELKMESWRKEHQATMERWQREGEEARQRWYRECEAMNERRQRESEAANERRQKEHEATMERWRHEHIVNLRWFVGSFMVLLVACIGIWARLA